MIGQLLKNIADGQKKDVFLSNQKTEKLEFSELRYRRLFEAAQDGILILDAESGKIEDINPFLNELLGYSHSELVGKELWEIGVFRDVVDSKKAFLELQAKGYIRYEDLPLHTKDDRAIDVEFVSNVYMVDNQRVIQCNVRDISDRKKAEEAVELRTKELEDITRSQDETKKAVLNVMEDLAEAKSTIEVEKAKDEAMLNSIGEGLIAFDNDRKVIIINKMAEDILGLKTKNVIGKEISDFLLEDEDGHQVPLDKKLASPALSKDKTNNYFFVRKDKTRFPIAVNVTPIKLGGKTIGTIDIFRDITREAEIDRAKSEFVSLASHQLRTPLGISKWYLEALSGKGFLEGVSKKAKDYLNEVYKSNERVLVLVRDLLSVSRIDQGTVRNTPRLVDITLLLKEVIKDLGILAAKNSILLKLELKKAKLPQLFIDHQRLQQIIENLIVNAIEYSDPGGVVDIIADTRDEMVLISVKDTGIGISSVDQKKIFTKFFRSVKATAKNTEGSGLGLYVVKSYIEGWGGKIEVNSREGKGSAFTVTLPIRSKKTAKL